MLHTSPIRVIVRGLPGFSINYPDGFAHVYLSLADVATQQDDDARARELYQQSLAHWKGSRDKSRIARGLQGLACLAAAAGQQPDGTLRAARLLGAVAALRDPIDLRLWSADFPDEEHTLDNLRTQLGEATFGTAWAEGRAMSLEQAIA